MGVGEPLAPIEQVLLPYGTLPYRKELEAGKQVNIGK